MKDTALNVVAIGIFIMTLSVLVGPMINLSPSIPAIATLSILGLLTFDTLGWENKGVNLFLDTLARFTPEHRERVLHHEAGHFLCAFYLGIPVQDYTLSAWEGLKRGISGVGGVEFDTTSFQKPLSPTEEQLLLDRFCTVWMAGIAAEQLAFDKVEGGGDDRQKITDALALFGQPSEKSPQKQQWGELQAKTLLERNWENYKNLVDAMRERKPVQECYQILGNG
ncbi:MAG: ATP-dependent Zn protease [Kamptonema sp. SIO4C4]|nr:ATP-dependent Zn protease [Kamptonema sp. SIO4C4]